MYTVSLLERISLSLSLTYHKSQGYSLNIPLSECYVLASQLFLLQSISDTFDGSQKKLLTSFQVDLFPGLRLQDRLGRRRWRWGRGGNVEIHF